MKIPKNCNPQKKYPCEELHTDCGFAFGLAGRWGVGVKAYLCVLVVFYSDFAEVTDFRAV